MSTFVRKFKQLHEMTTEELRQAADQQALEYYRNRALENPHDEAAQKEYTDYCVVRGIEPQTGKPSRFASMSTAQIAQEWEAEGAKVEAQNLDGWREQNANVWMASQPEYEPTPDNAKKLVAEIERRGLRGTVTDLEVCFDYLVKHGDIQPKPLPPAPLELLTESELRELPLDQMKSYIEECGRKGIL